MKKGYSIFILGFVVGMLVKQYVFKNEMGVWDYVFCVGMLLVFSNDKLTEFIFFLFLTSYVVTIPFTWVNGDIRWYEPLVMLYVLISLVYSVFIRDKGVVNPLMIDRDDIVRFPPQTIPEVV